MKEVEASGQGINAWMIPAATSRLPGEKGNGAKPVGRQSGLSGETDTRSFASQKRFCVPNLGQVCLYRVRRHLVKNSAVTGSHHKVLTDIKPSCQLLVNRRSLRRV